MNWGVGELTTTLNVVFSVTYYLELQKLHIFTIDVIFFYQVKMLMLYNVQTTNSTFVGKNKIYNK